MKKNKIVLTKVIALLILLTVLLSACAHNSSSTEAEDLEKKFSLLEEKIASLEKALDESNEKLEKEINALENHQYDFYLTLGTLPTLYATLNAYSNQNPNTYMWFYRGNTISYEHTADFINYFETSAKDGTNLEDAIKFLIDYIINNNIESENSRGNNPGVDLTDTSHINKPTSCC